MGIADAGRYNVAELIGNNAGGDEFDAIAIGDDDASFEASQTELQNEVDRETGIDASTSDDVMTLEASFTDNDATIREVSIFESESADEDMLARQTIDDVNVESSDTLEITWDITIEN